MGAREADRRAMATAEVAAFQTEVRQVEAWFRTPRFSTVTRPYSAEHVVSLRSTLMQVQYHPRRKYGSATYTSTRPMQQISRPRKCGAYCRDTEAPEHVHGLSVHSTPSRSCRWPSTSTRSTSRAGSVLLRPRRLMNLGLTWLTILWTRSRVKSIISFALRYVTQSHDYIYTHAHMHTYTYTHVGVS